MRIVIKLFLSFWLGAFIWQQILRVQLQASMEKYKMLLDTNFSYVAILLTICVIIGFLIVSPIVNRIDRKLHPTIAEQDKKDKEIELLNKLDAFQKQKKSI